MNSTAAASDSATQAAVYVYNCQMQKFKVATKSSPALDGPTWAVIIVSLYASSYVLVHLLLTLLTYGFKSPSPWECWNIFPAVHLESESVVYW